MTNPYRRLLRAAVLRWSRTIRLDQQPWDHMSRELDRWRGAPVRFWWRDDDAVAATPALDRLLALRAETGLPLALAVIPCRAAGSLAEAVRTDPAVRILLHGWDHRNHAGSGAPSSEYPATRAPEEVRRDLEQGRGRLDTLFGGQSLAVLVPPFNTIAPALGSAVAQAGIGYVSMDRDFADVPMPCRNVHADVVDWERHTAVPAAEAVRPLIAALRLRRLGLVSRSEPIGVMTHHLAHDEAAWDLTARLLRLLAGHPSAAFPPIDAIFPAG